MDWLASKLSLLLTLAAPFSGRSKLMALLLALLMIWQLWAGRIRFYANAWTSTDVYAGRDSGLYWLIFAVQFGLFVFIIAKG